jgi:hypothetical protein
MGRKVLVVGLIATAIGGLVGAIRGVGSVVLLLDQPKGMTDAMVWAPFSCAYDVILNSALFVVFGWVRERMPPPTTPPEASGPK